jgi:hypothetical protein
MLISRDREERLTREGAIKSNLAQDRFTWDQEKSQRLEGLNERKLKLQQMQEDRMLKKSERELKDAERIEFDTDAFERGEEELRSAGYLPGSSEYREGVLNLGARHPYTEPGFRRGVYEGAKITMDADEIQAQLADIQAKNPGAAVTLSPDGRPIVRGKATRDLQSAQKDLDAARKMFGDAKKSSEPSNIAYAESRVRQLEDEVGKLGGVTGPKTEGTPTTQAQTIWRVDKAGNRWEYDANTKQPTGNHVPAK